MPMKVQFNIEYRTSFGEELQINISLHKVGEDDLEKQIDDALSQLVAA